MSSQSILHGRLSKNQRIVLDYYRERLQYFVRAYTSNRPAMIGTAILTFFVLMGLFAPYIAPYETGETIRNENELPKDLASPDSQNYMGTTHLANDVFSQWVYGSRISLLVGGVSGVAVMVVGLLVGLIAGFYKGPVDLISMRLVDVLFGVPTLPLVLVVSMFFGASVWNVIIVMALVMWRNMARVIRAEALSHSERPYVKSARAAGASNARIMGVHIAPNLLPLAVTEGTIAAGLAVVLEANISFLGFGAQNTTSWGAMLQLAFTSGAIRSAWWWVIPPGLSITMLVVSFFFISRGIEEITNPEREHGVV